MCLFALLLLFSARLASVVWWIAQPNRWEAAFNGSWVWPLLGIVLVPWTTLMWVAVAPTGNPVGADWLWIGIALLGDVATYGSNAYGNRNRIGYSSY
jgi:hypothetical protein